MFFSDTLVFGFDRYLESDIFALEKCITEERKSSLSKKVVAFLILSTATLKSWHGTKAWGSNRWTKNVYYLF